MKNSDMKIIAIILAVALFFTIITSNAVSVASVILLAKDSTATTDDPASNSETDDPAANTNQPAANTNQPAANTNQPAADANANSNANTNADANKPADNAGAAGQNDIEKDPLAAFQKAAKAINQDGAAGYSKKSWQGITGDLKLSAFDFLSSTLKGLIEGFMTKEADADVKENAKGSDDAKRRFPLSNCTPNAVASAKAEKSGENYIVTIVLKDQVNPRKADTDGLTVMSGDFLYIEDVEDTIKNDPTVSKIVKSLDKGEITYKAYTITATMTADGKFVEVKHYCDAALVATVTVGPGQLTGEGGLSFNVHYFDFKY